MIFLIVLLSYVITFHIVKPSLIQNYYNQHIKSDVSHLKDVKIPKSVSNTIGTNDKQQHTNVNDMKSNHFKDDNKNAKLKHTFNKAKKYVKSNWKEEKIVSAKIEKGKNIFTVLILNALS